MLSSDEQSAANERVKRAWEHAITRNNIKLTYDANMRAGFSKAIRYGGPWGAAPKKNCGCPTGTITPVPSDVYGVDRLCEDLVNWLSGLDVNEVIARQPPHVATCVETGELIWLLDALLSEAV